jgi:hypothetical protein
VNARQLAKLLLLLSLSSAACYGVLRLTNGSAAPVFEEILTAFLVVAMLLSALSVAMFTYLDNIAKDLTELRNEVDRSNYAVAHEKLTALKREVLYNGALIVFLLILERSIKGAAGYLTTQLPQNASLIVEISVTLRVALFVTSVWAASAQLKGFLIAAEFRDVIAKNRR